MFDIHTYTFIYTYVNKQYTHIHTCMKCMICNSITTSLFLDTGNTFAPGNLRATADNNAYQALVNYWIENKYTLRYSGGLVPDVYHILIKGQGVLSNASSLKAKVCMYVCMTSVPSRQTTRYILYSLNTDVITDKV